MARRRKPASKNARTERVFLRLEEELMERIETHIERMNQTYPGLGVTKSDALRSLLYKGLELYEAEEEEEED